MSFRLRKVGLLGVLAVGLVCSCPPPVAKRLRTDAPGIGGAPAVVDLDGPGDLSAPDLMPAGGCIGRQCQIDYYNCSVDAGATTLTGTVTIPAGNLPVANATVYIPSGDIPPPPDSGATGNFCRTVIPADAAAHTTTAVDGSFTLAWVPSGQDIPLVISIGKWRRVVIIPSITPCTHMALPADQTRLPRNRAEGNIPRIALSTGGEDALECLLRGAKLGLDDAEFTDPTQPGRVNLLAGGLPENGTAGATRYDATLNGGRAFPPANGWWDQISNLNQYDLVLLSCEGDQNPTTKSPAAHLALQSYVDQGGRVLASHWQNIWIAGGVPPITSVASFVANSGYVNDVAPVLATIRPDYAPAAALASWLLLPSVGGSSQPGQLPIRHARATVTSRSAVLTHSWIDLSDPTLAGLGLANPSSQYFSFAAPIGAAPALQYGRMGMTDLHASGSSGDQSSPAKPFPTGCTSTGLTPQEQALIYILFDLTGCP